MAEYGTVVKARWPFTPLGVSVEVTSPDTSFLGDVGSEVNDLVEALREGTPLGRFVKRIVLPVLRKLGVISK